jgi:hypothetical protein
MNEEIFDFRFVICDLRGSSTRAAVPKARNPLPADYARTLSLTPRFSGVHQASILKNRFSGFQSPEKPVQAVHADSRMDTPLKRGVNKIHAFGFGTVVRSSNPKSP